MTQTELALEQKPIKRLRPKLKTNDRFKVYDFLKQVIEPGDNGRPAYRGKWNDESVARHLGFTASQVSSVRIAAYGKLHVKAKKADTGMTQRLQELEQRLAYLERQLGVTA